MIENREEIIKKMQEIMSQQEGIESPNIAPKRKEEIFKLTEEEVVWVKNLAPIKDDEFLFKISFAFEKIIVCVRDLDWMTYQNIEVESYHKSQNSDNIFYSGETERREVLASAIIWIADVNTREIKFNKNKDILQYLNSFVIELIWEKYLPNLILTSQEANALYSSAYDYFTGNIENKPIPAIVIEVDMMIKFSALSRQEIRAIKTSEMERIKLILKARSRALRLDEIAKTEEPTETKSLSESMGFPDNFFPPNSAFMGKGS